MCLLQLLRLLIKNMFITFFQMSRVYTAQYALEIIINGGESDFESSDDEEITELAIDEEEVTEHNIDDYFSSSDDEPLSTYRTNPTIPVGRWRI